MYRRASELHHGAAGHWFDAAERTIYARLMASICQDIVIEASPGQVWAVGRDVDAVHRRLTPGHVVDTRIDGDTRMLTLPNSGMVRELIVAIDDEAHRLADAVVEGRMPLLHHHASFQVFAECEDRSRLVWITDALPHELAAEIRPRVERGAAVMKQTIENEVRQLAATS